MKAGTKGAGSNRQTQIDFSVEFPEASEGHEYAARTRDTDSIRIMSTGTTIAPPVWTLASASDVDDIIRLAEAIHPAFPERPEVFAEKLSLFPSGCYVLVWHEEVVGYGLSHPWILNCIPPLDSLLDKVPGDTDCLYIHDVAILPEVRGRGSAALYVELMVERAHTIGVNFLALISVCQTVPLWARYGFEVANCSELGMKLQSYGPTARYMTRTLRVH